MDTVYEVWMHKKNKSTTKEPVMRDGKQELEDRVIETETTEPFLDEDGSILQSTDRDEMLQRAKSAAGQPDVVEAYLREIRTVETFKIS